MWTETVLMMVLLLKHHLNFLQKQTNKTKIELFPFVFNIVITL